MDDHIMVSRNKHSYKLSAWRITKDNIQVTDYVYVTKSDNNPVNKKFIDPGNH